jgi:hypothetical protein
MNLYYIESMETAAERWLSRVRHDLVKRLLWAARDRQDLGGPVVDGELVATILDEEGRPARAADHFQALCGDARPWLAKDAQNRFGQALVAAEMAARRNDLAGVLALEGAFDDLARAVKKGRGDAQDPGH